MKKFTTRQLAVCGIIAALYAAITIACASFAYGPVQFRLSEALCILPFFAPFTSAGLFVGCLIANLFSTVSALDIVVGSAATLLGCLWTAKCKKAWFAPLPTVIVNFIMIGAMLAAVNTPDNFWMGFLTMGAQVGLGELLVMYVLGLPLLLSLKKTALLDRLKLTSE